MIGRKLGVWPVWLFSLLAFPALAQDISKLPGTYAAVQRVPESQLKAQGIGPRGGTGEGIGAVGEPIAGSLVIGPDKTFRISMSYIDEGTWDLLHDDKTAPFLRFTGARDTFDVNFRGEYGLKEGALGAWMKEGDDWFLVEFHKAAEPGFTTNNPYGDTEAAMSSMFGQGDIDLAASAVAQGSASGSKIAGGAFSKKTRFSSYRAPNAPASDERIVLLFDIDGRFTIQNTATDAIQKGAYSAKGAQLSLRLEGATEDDVWDVGRDRLSGRFAIRPQSTGGNFFLEVPLEE